MLSNCGAEEDFWEPPNWKIKPVNPEGNQPWTFIGRTDNWNWNSDTLVTCCEELTHRKDLMLGKTEGKWRRGDRGRDI